MQLRIGILLLALPLASLADVCPKKGERVETTPYEQTFKCPAAVIVVAGEKNPEEYESCLGDVLAASETVSYLNGGQVRRPLPSVSSLSPQEDQFTQSKVWMVSKVGCDGSAQITIRYWGGGNCVRCEQSVQYKFDKNGQFTVAHLK